MKQRQLNPRYFRQFKQQYIHLPAEVRHKHFAFGLYSGYKEEISFLEDHFNKAINHLPEIIRLARALENHSYPACNRVVNYSKRMLDIFSGYQKAESVTGRYYNRLLNTIRNFLSVATDLRDTVKQIFEKLKKYPDTSGRFENVTAGSSDIAVMGATLKTILKAMESYQGDFTTLLREEEKKLNVSRVTTYVEQELLRLINFIENSVMDMKSRINEMEQLEGALARVERNEIYN